jgi:hypothetical protein
MLRDESRHCQNANAAALLQEVAAWLEGGTIFDGERTELWEHADRLCGSSRCPTCGGLRVMRDDPLCFCDQPKITTGSIMDAITIATITLPTNDDIGLGAEIGLG